MSTAPTSTVSTKVLAARSNDKLPRAPMEGHTTQALVLPAVTLSEPMPHMSRCAAAAVTSTTHCWRPLSPRACACISLCCAWLVLIQGPAAVHCETPFDWLAAFQAAAGEQGAGEDAQSSGGAALSEGLVRLLLGAQVSQAAGGAAGWTAEQMHELVRGAAADGMELARTVVEALGPQLAQLTPKALVAGTSGSTGVLHVHLGQLLDLGEVELESRMAALSKGLIDAISKAAPASTGAGTTSGSSQTPGAGDGGTEAETGAGPSQDSSQQQSKVSRRGRTLQGSSSKSSKARKPGSRLGDLAGILGQLDVVLAGGGSGTRREKLGERLRAGAEAFINVSPKIRRAEKVRALGKILADQLAGLGAGLGQGCTPYVFSEGGAPLPETLVFPSFSLAQTSGNCVLIPEILGAPRYPGQWAQLNTRVACLGPASEYLLTPAVYRGAATSAEAFACPTCRNEVTLGPEVRITLAGDPPGMLKRYASRAEFLTALQSGSAFGFGEGGLEGVITRLQGKLEARGQVLERVLGGGVLGALMEGLAGGGWKGAATGHGQDPHPEPANKGAPKMSGSGTAMNSSAHTSGGHASTQSGASILGWKAAVTSAMEDLRTRIQVRANGTAYSSPLNITRLVEAVLPRDGWAGNEAGVKGESGDGGSDGASPLGVRQPTTNSGRTEGDARSGGSSCSGRSCNRGTQSQDATGQRQADGAGLAAGVLRDAVGQLLQQGHVRWLEALAVDPPLSGGVAASLPADLTDVWGPPGQ